MGVQETPWPIFIGMMVGVQSQWSTKPYYRPTRREHPYAKVGPSRTRRPFYLILKAKTDRLARMNLDTLNVEPPCQRTLLSYNSALMSLTQLKCDTKTVYREAAETSQRNILTDACGILAVLSYIAPMKTGIPLKYRFDEKTSHAWSSTQSSDCCQGSWCTTPINRVQGV